MSVLLRIGTIAVNTVREAVRNKLLYALLLFAVLLILSGTFLSTLSYVESERILQDIGMGRVLEQIPDGGNYYLTIDADGFDPAVMPAVAGPGPSAGG